jgi:hypothetical protein
MSSTTNQNEARLEKTDLEQELDPNLKNIDLPEQQEDPNEASEIKNLTSVSNSEYKPESNEIEPETKSNPNELASSILVFNPQTEVEI